MKAGRGDGNLYRLQRSLTQDRFLSVISVVLLLEHGNVFLRDDVERYIFDRDLVQLWINRDEVDRPRFLHVDVTKIAVGFVADHVGQRGYEAPHITGAPAARS